MARLFTNYPVVQVPAVYIGPGNVVASANVWYGLRAYSSAAIGTSAIRLRRDSDNAESDFATIAGGGLDVSGITSFKGGANLFVTKLYDQSGGGFGLDLVQATAANQPGFTLTGGPGTGPTYTMTFASASSQYLLNSSVVTSISQPISFSAVAKAINNTARMDFFRKSGVGAILGFDFNAVNQIWVYAGSSIQVFTGTDSIYHTIQAVLSSPASSAIMIDSIDTFPMSGDPGTGELLFSGQAFYLSDVPDAVPFNGNFQEVGSWPIALSLAQRTDLDSNQRSYWGF